MEHGTPQLNVLLIDEAGWLRSALELALGLRGDALTATDDPAVALERMQAGDVDLAIVGAFASGGHDNVAICRSLRGSATGRLASLVPWIVACVPAEEPQRALDAIDAGANSFLTLPVDVRQLRARLAQIEQLLDGLAGRAAQPETVTPSNGAGRAREVQQRGLLQSSVLAEQALDPLLVVSPEGVIAYALSTAEALFGSSPDELTGTSVYIHMHPDDTARAFELVSTALESPEAPPPVDLRVVHRDGSVRDVDIRAANMLATPGVGGIVLTMHDITERKRFEEQLERQALYDSLTRLPNRTLFMDYLEHALARADRRLESVVVMFFDLDNFKLVNDTFGHAYGDALLARVGERLRGCLRASDTASRWGGDEFTVLLEDVATEQDAIVVAERVSSALSAPFSIDEREVYISASIGIAFSTPSQSRPSDLLRDADVALYRAKAAGKSQWMIFEGEGFPLSRPAMLEHTRAPVDRELPAPSPASDTPLSDESLEDDALRLLMSRISALEREAGRLEAALEEERRRSD